LQIFFALWFWRPSPLSQPAAVVIMVAADEDLELEASKRELEALKKALQFWSMGLRFHRTASGKRTIRAHGKGYNSPAIPYLLLDSYLEEWDKKGLEVRLATGLCGSHLSLGRKLIVVPACVRE
jgi:hypothetical protein